MKRIFISLALLVFIVSCGDDQAKIEELQQKLNQQERAIQEEKQRNLERELEKTNAELDKLKEKDKKTKKISEPKFNAYGFGSYPEASERDLDDSELSDMTERELKIMRNEIFARHGYIFKTKDMKNYFSAQSWYRPMYSNVTNRITIIEKKNIDLIKSFENGDFSR
jgi:small-conductance mechanosensitive channel